MRITLRKLRAWISRPKIMIQEKPVLSDSIEYCKNPVFLIGVHRSGTSLMRRIFNKHPSFACPPETYFIQNYVNIWNDSLAGDGFSAFGYDKYAVKEHLRKQAVVLHEAYRITQNKSRWADKTPQYIECLNEINELFGEQTKYIMIYRHPFAVVESIREKGWDLQGRVVPGDVSSIAEHLSASYKNQMDFQEKNAAQCISYKYEDLIENPARILKILFEFVGDKFYEEVLDFNSQSHNFGTEDTLVRGLSRFEISDTNWSSWTKEEAAEVKSKLGWVCLKLGYSD